MPVTPKTMQLASLPLWFFERLLLHCYCAAARASYAAFAHLAGAKQMAEELKLLNVVADLAPILNVVFLECNCNVIIILKAEENNHS